MLIPLKDDNPLTRIRFQYVTVVRIAINVAAFLWQVSLGPEEDARMIRALGMIPAVLFGTASLPPDAGAVAPWISVLTSMFLHGGWMHLIGNMVFLWVLGDNIEDSLGHLRFLFFYITTGVLAALAHGLADPASTIPTIGASGAISGVIGGYLVLHPKARILTLVVRFVMRIPAFVVLGGWIGLQVLNASIDDGGGGGVAWWAHIGGFVAGTLLVVPMRRQGVALFNGAFGQASQPPDTDGPLRRWRRERGKRSSVPDSGKARGRDGEDAGGPWG